MLLEISFACLLFSTISFVLLLIRWRVAYRVLRSCSIKGPSPVLYYGNTKQIRDLGLLKFIEINLQKYGNIFGYYVGIRSTIVIKDLDMLKQILVKQFETFIDREYVPNLLRKSPKVRGLLLSQGEQWRRTRRILSKSFNTVNLSKMSPIIERSCESLVMKLSDHADTGKSFDIWKLYGFYTMEVILATGFGHYADVINGEANELSEASASLFAYVRRNPTSDMITVLSNFPFLEDFIRHHVMKSKFVKNYISLDSIAEELVRKRLEEERVDAKYQDLLQLLIDARAESDDEDEREVGHTFIDPYKRKLTDVEIVRTCISFLLAGHETTNNALGYTSYLLALHTNQQDKLYKEISGFYAQKPGASLYEAAQSLTYMDMVVQESLRIFPPAPLTNRHTSKTIEINGQVLPKGSTVVVPIMAIHHSPDIWPEPSSFRPERFTKEEKEKRHQMAHMPFGWGPRSCIGMRFALMEAKMALITIMKEFKFVEAPDTEKPLRTSFGITMIPTNGIYLKLERRH